MIGGGGYNAAQATSDLTYIVKSCGIHYIRMALPAATDTSGIANCKAAALVAQSLGAYVSVGISAGGSAPFTTASQAAYKAAIISMATWAQANHMDELCVGNEFEDRIDGTTMTLADIPPFMRAMAAAARAAGFTGALSCGTYLPGQMWQNDHTLGDLTYVTVNAYGNYADDHDGAFEAQIQTALSIFGAAHTYLTEWNLSYQWPFPLTAAQQKTECARRYAYIESSGLQRADFFCYRAYQDQFSLKLANGTFAPFAAPILVPVA